MDGRDRLDCLLGYTTVGGKGKGRVGLGGVVNVVC